MCLAVALAPPSAQEWPTRTIRVIIPLTAGAATDIMARAVFDQVSQQLGQPIIVENRPGAGNTIGMAAVAQAEPDGYTILANSSTHTVSPATRSKLPFNVLTDLSGVIPLGNMPVVMAVNPKKGYKTLADFVNYARKNPGAINYASAGAGNSSHLNGERFRLAAKFEAVHVPQRGAPEALTEVIAGRLDFYFAPLLNSITFLREGTLQALAVSRIAARLGAARRADDGRGRLSELRVQFLGRRVRAGEDPAGDPQQAACRDRQGAQEPGAERAAREARRRPVHDHAGAVRRSWSSRRSRSTPSW